MSTLLVVDGNNIAHRAKHVFSLSNGGVDVSTVYGFLSIVTSYIKKYKPDSVVITWDGGIPEYRRKAVPQYKANRDHGDSDPLAYQDFIRQLDELSSTLIPMFGMLSLRFRYIEADDIIYHTCLLAEHNYDRIIVATADEDLLQVLRISNTVILNPNNNDLRDAEWLGENYGIDPGIFVHWKALQGDSSDNIPGVPGIGVKTATKLFAEFGSLSGIFNAAAGCNPAGKIGGKRGERIVETGFEQISKNVSIMALAFDRTGVRWRIYTSWWKPGDAKGLRKYFIDNAFTSMMVPEIYNIARTLEQPKFSHMFRMPIICDNRKPHAASN